MTGKDCRAVIPHCDLCYTPYGANDPLCLACIPPYVADSRGAQWGPLWIAGLSLWLPTLLPMDLHAGSHAVPCLAPLSPACLTVRLCRRL